MEKSVGRGRCKARDNNFAQAQRARQLKGRILGQMGAEGRKLKAMLRKDREQREKCSTAKESIIFRPAYRDAKTGRFIACGRQRRGVQSNPRGVVVYPRLIQIRAEYFDGKLYKHDFDSRTPILGLPDGSLLIPARGRPLWGEV